MRIVRKVNIRKAVSPKQRVILAALCRRHLTSQHRAASKALGRKVKPGKKLTYTEAWTTIQYLRSKRGFLSVFSRSSKRKRWRDKVPSTGNRRADGAVVLTVFAVVAHVVIGLWLAVIVGFLLVLQILFTIEGEKQGKTRARLPQFQAPPGQRR